MSPQTPFRQALPGNPAKLATRLLNWLRARRRLLAGLGVLGLIVVLLDLSLAAGGLSNGGFETLSGAAPGNGSYTTQTNSSSGAITGWTVSGGTAYLSHGGGPANPKSSYPSAHGGSYYAMTSTTSTIAQTFTTVPGASYTLSFYYNLLGNNGFNTYLQVNVTNGSSCSPACSNTFVGGNSGTTPGGWFLGPTITFTAATTTSSVQFSTPSAGSSAPATVALDDVAISSPATLSGTVFEDVNYGGGAGRTKSVALANGGHAVNGATVELYDGSGNYQSSTTTNSSGSYSFNVSNGSTYTVRVVNRTVLSGRASASNALLPVQTFRTTASSGSAVNVTDHVGGENPALADAAANSGNQNLAALTTASATPQSITQVVVGSSAVSGLDFGFNFDTIVNTNDSGQGSLRQWINNANTFTDQASLLQSGFRAIAGVNSALPAASETSIFMIPAGTAVAGLNAGDANQLLAGGWARISPASQLPTLSATRLVLDGATQTYNVGNTNAGTTGTGGTVGVSATVLPLFDLPEVEIYGAYKLTAGADNQALRALALSAGAAELDGSGSQATDLLVGMDGSGSSNATSIQQQYNGITVGTGSNVTVHHNYVRVNNSGIRRDGAGSNLLIEYNEVGVPYNGQTNTFDGVIVATGSGDTIQYNLLRNQVGAGMEVPFGGGTNFVFQENTVYANGRIFGGTSPSNEPGGVVIYASVASPRPQLTMLRNIITGSGGPGIDIMVGDGFKITQNAIYGNGVGYTGGLGIGIDIDTSGRTDGNNSAPPDGVTLNTGVVNTALPNHGMNYPVITSGSILNGVLTVAGYVGTASSSAPFANATLEFFASSGNASGYGEGQTYLGTLTADASGKFSGSMTLPTGVTLTVGNPITGTATDANSDTSEFGPNFTVSAGNPPPTGFNAFESSTASGATSGVIKTKIAGSAFNLDVVVINSSGSVYTGFTGTVTLQLLDASNNTGALGSNGCRASWVALGGTSSATFASANNGRVTSPSFTVGNAYRDVRVQISYTPSGGGSTVVACSNDDFAIRPYKLALLQASDTNWSTTGTTRLLSNGGASGGNVHKAGQPFTLTAQAQSASGASTSLYSGTASAGLVCLLPSGCSSANLGTLTASPVFSAGAMNVSATYSEAGAVTLTLTDTTFAAVDAADSSTAERYVVSDPVTVGRFVPDHFALSVSSNGSLYTFGSGSCSARAFSYVGQTITFASAPQILVTAQNASNGTTQNYSGALWKLNSASVTQSYSDGGSHGLTATLGSATVTSNGNGTGIVSENATDTLVWTRSTTTPAAPFTALPLNSVNVSDSSESSGSILSLAAAQAAPTFDISAAMRFGRLAVGNAFGIELLPLAIPVETQYYTGQAWATNTLDSCTAIPAGSFTMSNWQRNLTAPSPCRTSLSSSATLAQGRASVSLSAPGGGFAGSVDLSINAGSSASGNVCVAASNQASSALAMAWLQGAWTGASYTVNPSGRASFGNFAMQPGYRREN